METIDIIVAVFFSCVVFIAGLSFARISASRDTQSFFSGGGVVPWWVSSISLYMSFFSVGTFVVWGSIAYSDGLASVAIQSTMCLAGVAVGFIIASRWNSSNAMTAAEFIGHRLGPKTRTIFTTLFLLTAAVGLGGALYPVGRIVEASTGISFAAAITFVALFILIYTAVGGLWAVLVTDILQFVVLTAAIVIVVPLAFAQIGGIGSLIEQAPEGFFSPTTQEYTWGFLIAFWIYNTIFIGGHWGYVQRYTSVSSPRGARKVAWLFAGLYLFSPILWMLPPMIYRIMEPGLTGFDNEVAYMLVSKEVLPNGVLGLMLCAMVFATASSINTVINISAAVFTNDVYAKIKNSASEKHLLNVGRAASAILGLGALGFAFLVQYFGGIVNLVLVLSAIIGGSIFLPPLWALFSRRQTGISITSVALASLSANIFINIVAPDMFGITVGRSAQMMFGVGFPGFLLLAFEFYYRIRGVESPRLEHYRAMQEQLARRKHETITASLAEGVDERANTIISVSVVAVGVILTVIGAMTISEASIVLAAGLVVIICGVALNKKVVRTLSKTSEPE